MTHPHLSTLISCIYDMVVGRSGWENILDSLSLMFPDCLVMVTGHDYSHGTNIAFSQRGLSPAAVSSFIGGYAVQNPWLAGQATVAPQRVFHDDQILARSEARRTPFFTGWLLPQGDFLASTGVVVLREGSRQLTLELRYAESNQGELRERAAAVLADAAQHLGRAIELMGQARFPVGRSYLDGVVAELPFTLFFLDEDMRIRYSNLHADAFRRHTDGPFTSVDGVLRGTDQETDSLLRELVRKNATSPRTLTSMLQISGPKGSQRYFAIARHPPRISDQFHLHDVVSSPGSLTMLVLHGSHDFPSLPTDLLWRAFSLTEAESQLAEALVGGATLADVAKTREVSKQTLRNQLVAVMRKTGTRRQPELVSLLTRLALSCV